ncbi:MAG: hypothetical protein JJ977_18875 [Kordiimonadaceae bacterium]|nr:hypothetical protein [Kordiimonadaceae bacterium]
MTKLLLALIIPVSGLVISMATALIYARTKKLGALLAAVGFGLTSLSWVLFPIVGKVLEKPVSVNEHLALIYQAFYGVSLFGAVLAALGMIVLARQFKGSAT